MATEWDTIRATLGRRFFVAVVVQTAVAIGIAVALKWMFGRSAPTDRVRLPVAFQFGTLFLILGSVWLHRARSFVQRERQREFRRALITALGFAVLFVGVQSYGLWAFVGSTTDTVQTQTNAHGFVFLFTVVHAGHFLIAQSILLWVTVCAMHGRYDHEYYWGVTFSGWCWHFLGIVWLGILCIFLFAANSTPILQPV